MNELGQPDNTTNTSVDVQIEEGQEQAEVKRIVIVGEKEEKRVEWEEGTVDNEFMGKKSSKICCQFHKPRAFGESDSESDEDDGFVPRKFRKGGKKKQEHEEGCVHHGE
eukprot:TRINITY_DN1232_c0_g1_i1.p1 TRINITY_DN1232_c0_g1~~TRINITY_DN1232_c0_g1_i1.p1  ORF type:complete len:109 (+),score=39.42 TRINITY_DN1232_c0_g1_i1:1-327(+)